MGMKRYGCSVYCRTNNNDLRHRCSDYLDRLLARMDKPLNITKDLNYNGDTLHFELEMDGDYGTAIWYFTKKEWYSYKVNFITYNS